jgi:hypothetical protein
MINNTSQGKNKILKSGSIILSIWSGINIFLASLILIIVFFPNGKSPILSMVFEKPEIAGLDAKVISALNSLTINYNSCDVALSALALFITWSGLINGKKWAFWALLVTIGFVEIFAFLASAEVGNVRWQVNVVQSVLYVVGIGLSGYSIFKRKTCIS